MVGILVDMEATHMADKHTFEGSTANCVSDCARCQQVANRSLPTLPCARRADATDIKRIKRITSHVGLIRYMFTICDTSRTIPRLDIPSPYAFSSTHVVYVDSNGVLVFIVETAHKKYDVFRVPATSPLSFPADFQERA